MTENTTEKTHQSSSWLLLPLIVGICVLVSGCTQSVKNEQTVQLSQMTIVPQEVGTADSKELTAPSSFRYAPYTAQLLADSVNDRRVLFFYANWCPTCIPADKSFSEGISQIPEDVTLIRVNYNDTETDQEEKDLAKKYGVTYQHTFVQIDSDGNAVKKWNGGKIEELLNNLL